MTKKSILVSLSIVTLFFFAPITTSSQADERSGVTDKEIIIGGIDALTGPASNLGPMTENASKLVTKQTNEAGGVHGRKIKFVMYDDGCGSSMGLSAIRKMIYDEKVFTMSGPACSHVILACRPILEKEKVPIMITYGQGASVMVPFTKYMFRVISPTFITADRIGQFIYERFPEQTKKTAIIYTQEEYGLTGKDALVKRLAMYNIKPIAIETTKIGDTDFSPQLLKIKALNPGVLVLLNYTKDMAVCLKQANELGVNCIKVGYMGSDFPLTPALAGAEAVKDFYGPTNLLDHIWSPTLKSFVDMYRKEYPDYLKNPFNPSMCDVQCYVGFQMIVEGLKRAGRDLTRTKYIEALETIRDFKTPWLPPINWTPTDHEGTREVQFVRYVNGKIEMVKWVKK